ncbi:Mutator-like transposase isoform 1 [Senna tora]|uniref:Mutator-like transposase isoform 1 n=1 Tax=Senna tora TaxID=362788 RepID=A0A834T9S4_9FABA|nr:Mutator-like transposase isoform 1 [Senna tora]
MGHNHSLGLSQNHDLDLGQSHEHHMGLGQAHDHELGLGHDHDHELDLGQSHDQGDDSHNYGHENELSMDQKPEHDDHELALSENNDMAVSENQEIDENLDLAIVQNPEMGIVSTQDMQSQLVVATTQPIIQARTVSVAPNYELSVGQEFPDVKSCRRALRDTAIALHFEMQTIKSDKTRFTAKCASEGCPWRIHAAKLPGVPTFTIRTIHENHTCGGIYHLVIEFEAKILEIEDISQDAAYWIRRIPPRLWATAYFEGQRFGHLTANIVESLNNWILEASGLPIIQMMECIRRQLMTWFNERRETSMQWTSILVPSAERRVAEALERARTYQVLRANEAEFEVISHEGTNIVDIRNRCCLCRGWQLYGLPCAHAVAALLSCRQNVHRFTESCFTVATYRKTYSQTIHPIPDKSLWKELSEGDPNASKAIEIIINPPKSLRPPGRPRKKRVRAEDRGRVKRVVHCSRCNQTGHFRTTCAAPN